MSAPRASTDEESAPLLQGSNAVDESRPSFFSALAHPTRQLTNLEKVLAAAGVALLILTGTFIGLFTGAEVALGKERAKGGGKVEWRTETKTLEHTTTATRTSTAPGSTITSVPTGKPEPEVCLTAECVQLAASILESLNTTIDPCEDFYNFANGGWIASHDIPADRGIFGSFNAVADRNKKIILKVIDSIPSSTSDIAPSSAEEANLHKVRAAYESCMDVNELNEVGMKPLVPLVEFVLAKFGKFDIVPSPDEDSLWSDGGDWSGAYTEAYEISQDLAVKGETANEMRHAKKEGKLSSGKINLTSEQGELEVYKHHKSSDERRDRITETLAFLHSRGVDAVLGFNIEGDAGGDDSQVQSLWLYQTSGTLPSKEYYEEKPIMDLYQSVVAGVLTSIAEHTSSKAEKRGLGEEVAEAFEVAGWPWPWPGDDKPDDKPKTPPKQDEPLSERMEKLAGKVVALERELVRAGADLEYLFNPHYSYNPYPTEKVDKALPFLSLPTYLSTYAPRAFPVNITVTYPPYLKAVSKIIDETPDHVLAGYFVTRVAVAYADALGPKVTVRKEMRRLQEVLRGIKKGTEENRVDLCLGYVNNMVGFIVGREFVKEAFSPEAKKEGEDIINSIVDAFHAKLPHISWMDKESATAAQKKAEAIIPKVGYPLAPNTTSPESLQRYYGRTVIKGDDFFGNLLRTTLTDVSRTWMMLGNRRDRQSWEMYPQEVNAYYSPPDGEIVFPAGILQPPFYSQEWPSNLKYGAFGAVAAHELTHAFDNSGSQYDEQGRLRQWWTNATTAAFEERAQCIAKQYSKYFVLDAEGKKVFVNGNMTNGEDIADSGLAQAYIAWKDTSSLDKSKSLHLPGLNYTDEQLFFVAYARVWASISRPAFAVQRVRTDPHSPNYWRATGTLRNLAAFHDAFGCKAGSGMNPPKKDQCELW